MSLNGVALLLWSEVLGLSLHKSLNVVLLLSPPSLNSSQVKIKYEFSKPFRSKRFSKYEGHAESEQFLWSFNYLRNN